MSVREKVETRARLDAMGGILVRLFDGNHEDAEGSLLTQIMHDDEAFARLKRFGARARKAGDVLDFDTYPHHSLSSYQHHDTHVHFVLVPERYTTYAKFIESLPSKELKMDAIRILAIAGAPRGRVSTEEAKKFVSKYLKSIDADDLPDYYTNKSASAWYDDTARRLAEHYVKQP